MVCRSFFVMSSPHSAKWHVSLTITSCDIVIAHHVRVMMMMVMVEMMVEMVEMMVELVVAVVMIARLVMLNVVKHLNR